VTDLARVVAHYAIAGPSEGYGDPADIHAFRIERLGWARVTSGGASLTIGRVRVTARLTTEREEADVAVLHSDDGETHCHVRTGSGVAPLATARDALFRDFAGHQPAGWPRALERHFGGRAYTTDDVFPDERRRLLARLAEHALETPEGASTCVGAAWRRLLDELRRVEGPIPSALASVARRLVARAASEELAVLEAAGPVTEAVDRIRALIAEARSLGIALELGSAEVALAIQSALGRVLGALRAGPTAAGVTDALALLGLGSDLEAPPDLWAAQNAVARLWREGSERAREALVPLMAALGFAPGAFAPARGQR
jgi:hypothetical protein